MKRGVYFNMRQAIIYEMYELVFPRHPAIRMGATILPLRLIAASFEHYVG
jgi:hypothetical protein